MTYYMIAGDGTRIGPLEAEELLKHGLRAETLVWRQDLPQWVAASQVPELKTLLNTATIEPPIPPCQPNTSQQKPLEQPNLNAPFGQIPNNNFLGQSAPSQNFNQAPQTAPFGNQQSVSTRPDNYMVWAILSALFCCVPFGIVSIVYASKVNDLWGQGKVVEAKSASDNARMWMLIGAGCGLFINMIAILCAVAG